MFAPTCLPTGKQKRHPHRQPRTTDVLFSRSDLAQVYTGGATVPCRPFYHSDTSRYKQTPTTTPTTASH
ncbi:MAG: hypothetical protein FWG68_08870 [Defluviitaleaceae bacterium]|nr:hypothetical protein [Defluviitaleaceae bacterium]